MPKYEIAPACEVTRVPLEDIVLPSCLSRNFNPRIDDESLFTDIAAYGITTACVGRLGKGNKVELLSGYRRFMALSAAASSLKGDAALVPVHVFRGLDDTQASVVSASSNIFTDATQLPSAQREALATFEAWVSSQKKDAQPWLPATREYRSAEVCALVTGRSVRTVFLLLRLQRDVLPGILDYMDVGFLSIHRAKEIMTWSAQQQKDFLEVLRTKKPAAKSEFASCLNSFMAGCGGEKYLSEALDYVRKAADYVGDEPSPEVIAIANDIRLQLKRIFPNL